LWAGKSWRPCPSAQYLPLWNARETAVLSCGSAWRACRGETWGEAELLGPRARYSWTLWEYLWEVAQPGAYTLMARATSTDGHTQRREHDPPKGGYQIHFCLPTCVHVASTQRGEDSPDYLHALVYDMNAFAEENSRLPLDLALEFTAGEGI